MKLSYCRAPAHSIRSCAGVFVAGMLLLGCERPAVGGGNRTLELDGDTITIQAGVTLHDVALKAVQSSDFLPARIRAKPGDIVRFTSTDARMHGLSIHAPTPEATSALLASGQQRSPPLVTRGQAWVVSLKNLPAGKYDVSCISHAGAFTLVIQ